MSDSQPLHSQNSLPVVPSTPGLALQDYVVLDKLASGGMATIHIAQRKHSDDVCIIKILHENYAQDPVVTSRFKREARVAALLDHPNIARLLDAKQDGEHFFLAMEFIAGKDLESLMFKLAEERRMLPPALSVGVGIRVLEGLHYAHTFQDSDGQHLGIVHRDLSPRNVMLTYEGLTKVIDFGLARARHDSFKTQPGMLLGTLRYMSPEQATAEPADHRSDIYTWGSVLYEALSGTWLARGETPQDILKAVVNEVPPPLSSYNPSLPKALDDVIARAIQKDPADRYPSALEFKKDFEAAAGDLASVTPSAIGEFLSGQYPEDAAKAQVLISNARRGEYTNEVTAMLDAPEFLATRAGVPEFTQVRPSSPSNPAPSTTPVLLGHPEAVGQELPQAHFEPTSVAMHHTAMGPSTIPPTGSVAFALPPPPARKANTVVVVVITVLLTVAAMMLYQRNTQDTKVAVAPPSPPPPTIKVVKTAPVVRPLAVPEPPTPTKRKTAPKKSRPPRKSSPKAPPPPVEKKDEIPESIRTLRALDATLTVAVWANGLSEQEALDKGSYYHRLLGKAAAEGKIPAGTINCLSTLVYPPSDASAIRDCYIKVKEALLERGTWPK